MSKFELIMEVEDNEYEPRSVLVVKRNGEEVKRFYDGGEPEDNSFGRDWSWVPDMIEKAYKWGVEDGAKE